MGTEREDRAPGSGREPATARSPLVLRLWLATAGGLLCLVLAWLAWRARDELPGAAALAVLLLLGAVAAAIDVVVVLRRRRRAGGRPPK